MLLLGPPGILIRPLSATDKDAWFSLWAKYLHFYDNDDLPEDITLCTWQRLLENRVLHGLVAEYEGHVIGFVHYLFHPSTWADHPYCYLEDLFVSEQARRLGVGRALIDAVSTAAKAAHSPRVYWFTQTTNTKAQALYNQLAEKADFLIYRQTLA